MAIATGVVMPATAAGALAADHQYRVLARRFDHVAIARFEPTYACVTIHQASRGSELRVFVTTRATPRRARRLATRLDRRATVRIRIVRPALSRSSRARLFAKLVAEARRVDAVHLKVSYEPRSDLGRCPRVVIEVRGDASEQAQRWARRSAHRYGSARVVSVEIPGGAEQQGTDSFPGLGDDPQ